MMKKLPHLLFALVLGMVAVFVILFAREEQPWSEKRADGEELVRVHQGHGIPHPKFESMLVGGPGPERHAGLLWLGWVFCTLQVFFFVGLLALGLRRRERAGPWIKPLAMGLLLYLAVFTMLMISYRHFMVSESHDLFLGFPIPTAWMMYGIWFVPIAFILLYVIAFPRLIWTDADQKQLDQIVAKQQAERQEEA